MWIGTSLLIVICLSPAAAGHFLRIDVPQSTNPFEDRAANASSLFCVCRAGGRDALGGQVSIQYPVDLNRAVLGLDAGGDAAIAGEGLRTYRIEIVNGPAPVSGELQWWVESETEDVNLVQTNPHINAQKPSLVSQWVTFAPCSSRVYVQNVWLVSTMAGVSFRARAAFTWRWGSYTQEIATHAGGVPLRLGAVRSGWGTQQHLAPDELGPTAKASQRDNRIGGEKADPESFRLSTLQDSSAGVAGFSKSTDGDGGDRKQEAAERDGPERTQELCPVGMTLVSAAVDLMQTWQAPQRHWSAYVEGVAMLLALKCPLIVFIDAAKIPLLADAMHPKARLIPFGIDDIHAAAASTFGRSFRERLNAMRDREWRARSWNWAKIAESEEYLTLVLLKPLLFARAAAAVEEPVEREGGLLVWVDAVKDCLTLLKPPLSLAGLHAWFADRQRQNAPGAGGGDTENIGADARPVQIFATAYAGIGTVCQRQEEDVDGLPCRLLPGFSIKASFFAAGGGRAARWLSEQYTRVLLRAFSQGYLLTEEYYLAMLAREAPAQFVLMDRSDNPMSDDDHCLPHSLLLPPESLPSIQIRWPPHGAAIKPEEAVLVFDFVTEGCPEHRSLADDSTTLFVVGVRELGEHDGREVEEKAGGRRFPGVAGTVEEISPDGLRVAMTRGRHLQLDVEPGVEYQVQVYRRKFPLSTRSAKITFTVDLPSSVALAFIDPSLVVDSRSDILDLLSSLRLQQSLEPRDPRGESGDKAGGVCVVVAAEWERLHLGADVAAVCTAQGLRVLYYLTGEAEAVPPRGASPRGHSDIDAPLVEWWDWMEPVEGGVLVVSLDGVGMTAEDFLAEVSVWFDTLSAGGLMVGTGLFDRSFWDPCCCRWRQSHVASGLEMWGRFAEVGVGRSLEHGFPSWFSPKS